jgi:hypothetical protein
LQGYRPPQGAIARRLKIVVPRFNSGLSPLKSPNASRFFLFPVRAYDTVD